MVGGVVLLQDLGEGLHHDVRGARLGRAVGVADELAAAVVVDGMGLANGAGLTVGVGAADFLKRGDCCQR